MVSGIGMDPGEYGTYMHADVLSGAVVVCQGVSRTSVIKILNGIRIKIVTSSYTYS